MLIEAGRTLALRRQTGGYLASFVGPQSLFIDIMMNVGLILWAANATGDDRLRQIALEHCRTTQNIPGAPRRRHGPRRHLRRGHRPIPARRARTRVGAPDSTWTRGLAWAIYGFTAVHRLSGEREFLDTARRCADYYLRRSPPDLVPLWDFDVPADAPHLWDSSAAAIAASGLWDLSEAVTDPAEARALSATAALTILETLCTDRFLARAGPSGRAS